MVQTNAPSGAQPAQKRDYADLPIDTPDRDLFGLDSFVGSLARSVRDMLSPRGVVIALNGPWGSGKSSAINLLKYHLAAAVDEGDLEIVPFNPWWFRGEEALVLAFFRELYAATNPSLSAKAKKVLPKLGARLLKTGGIVAPAADALGAGGAGAIAAGAMNWVSDLIKDSESVDKLHTELSAALAGQKKRFVVLIDDIDRLAPDEALAMFRLVKSVGQLPNVIYVLAFDRQLAEKVVSERFPSEGPHYLEKIVQASFELPIPEVSDIQRYLLDNIGAIVGDVSEQRVVHVMNMFHDVVVPEMRTPRDAVRYLNALSITWPAIAGEVDPGDFMALEAYRLFEPAVYLAIRANKQAVCGAASMSSSRSQTAGADLDALLLSSIEDKTPYRRGLMRLFPKLASVWSNTFYDGRGWAKDRRACDETFFPAYFRLSLPGDAVRRRDIEELLARADDTEFVHERLARAVGEVRADGRTQAAALLDALNNHATDMPVERAEPLLAGVFAVADELDVEADRAKAFSIGDNNLRIHWLLRSLLRDRTTLAERSAILMNAAKSASFGWLVDLASSAWGDYHPRADKEPEGEENCLTTEADASQLVARALKTIKKAARDGSLIERPDLASVLFRWRDFEAGDGLTIKKWTATRLRENHSVARLAAAFTSSSWSQSMGFDGTGDVVAKRSDVAQVGGLDSIMDPAKFRSRLESLAKTLDPETADHRAVVRFLNAWDNRGQRNRSV